MQVMTKTMLVVMLDDYCDGDDDDDDEGLPWWTDGDNDDDESGWIIRNNHEGHVVIFVLKFGFSIFF